jgi:hypothetical protein
VAVPAGVDLPEPCVDLSYVDLVRERRRRPLLDCVTTRFEDVAPVRPFRWSRGERHFAGWYWAATTGQHVGFESWLDRDRLLLLDFDPKVTGIASQPFWLYWHDGERERRHARTTSPAARMARRWSPTSVRMSGSSRRTRKRSS